MYCLTICDIVFKFDIPKELILSFEKRVTFSTDIKTYDVLITLKQDNALPLADDTFKDLFEPIFTNEGFYREVPNVCRLLYNSLDNNIVVEYFYNSSNAVYAKDMIVDATLQFVSLCLLYHDIYPIHAACVELDHNGIILFGNSGAGKTSLEFFLIINGFKFYSDDIVYLNEKALLNNNAEYVLALRRDVASLAYGYLHEIEKNDVSGDKILLNMKKYYCENRNIEPLILLFPAVSETESGHAIKQLSYSDTIIRLIQLTISSNLPSKYKSAYFKRLNMLTQKTCAYEVIRSRNCNIEETKEICNEILSLVKKGTK